MRSHMHHNRSRNAFRTATALFAVVSLAWLGEPTAAETPDLLPAWYCLPPQTTVAVRVPNGKTFADALRKQTKLGTMIFSDERIDRFKNMIIEQHPKEWESFKDQLTEYGLAPDDFPAMLAGESGFAILIDPTEDGELADPSASAVALSWLEPGDELAERAMTAIGKVIADHEDDEQGPKRVDIEINDRPVMHISLPVLTMEHSVTDFDWPKNFSDMTEDQRNEILERFNKHQEQPGTESVAYNHLLLTRIGGRLLAANTFDSTEASTADTTHLTTVFARFLAAHEGADGGFAERIATTDGVKQTLPQGGITMIEVYADVSPLIGLADAEPDVARVVKALGIDALDVAALRATLNGTLLRTGMFLAVPEPRTGLLAILDQPPLEPKPPAWVPSNIMAYSHTSADLGKIYTHIKELMLHEFGQEAQMPFQMAEGWVQGVAQADLATLLSSFGHKHMVLNFEPELDNDPADDEQPMMQQMHPLAIVWDTKQDELLSRVLNALAAMTGNNNAISATEEQGFNGWRFKAGNQEGGLMLGKGYMVLAIGRGVLEKTLSSLNQPLEGPDAMLTGEVFEKARTMLPLEPGIMFQVMDGHRYSRTLKHMIDAMLAQMEWSVEHAGDDEVVQHGLGWIANVRKVLPADDELEDLMGPAVVTIQVNDLGLNMKSVNDFPAP